MSGIEFKRFATLAFENIVSNVKKDSKKNRLEVQKYIDEANKYLLLIAELHEDGKLTTVRNVKNESMLEVADVHFRQDAISCVAEANRCLVQIANYMHTARLRKPDNFSHVALNGCDGSHDVEVCENLRRLEEAVDCMVKMANLDAEPESASSFTGYTTCHGVKKMSDDLKRSFESVDESIADMLKASSELDDAYAEMERNMVRENLLKLRDALDCLVKIAGLDDRCQGPTSLKKETNKILSPRQQPDDDDVQSAFESLDESVTNMAKLCDELDAAAADLEQGKLVVSENIPPKQAKKTKGKGPLSRLFKKIFGKK